MSFKVNMKTLNWMPSEVISLLSCTNHDIRKLFQLTFLNHVVSFLSVIVILWVLWFVSRHGYYINVYDRISFEQHKYIRYNRRSCICAKVQFCSTASNGFRCEYRERKWFRGPQAKLIRLNTCGVVLCVFFSFIRLWKNVEIYIFFTAGNGFT